MAGTLEPTKKLSDYQTGLRAKGLTIQGVRTGNGYSIYLNNYSLIIQFVCQLNIVEKQ